MKKNRIKQTMILILVMMMFVSPTFANIRDSKTPTIRANFTLDEMKYEHIEYEEIKTMLNKAKTMIKRGNQADFYKWENEYYNLYCKLQSMIQLIHLKYTLNTNQKDYFEEYLYSVELLGKMKSGYIALFEEEETNLSDEMKTYYELSIERNKLVDIYYDKQMSVTIDINNEDTNIVQLLSSTTLSKAEKLAYYDRWYSTYNEEAGEIFLKLVAIDNQVAKLQGYESYAEYMYEGYEREYSIAESKNFFNNVKTLVPQVFAKLDRLSFININELRNYSYVDEAALLNAIKTNFINQYPALEEAYQYLTKYNLYDISPRENKEGGGFTVYLEGFNEPFMLLNYSSPYQTTLSFIHEFGHYYSYFKVGEHGGGLDLDETYSQALELLAIPSYDKLLGSEVLGKEAGIYILKNIVGAIIDGCLYDEFLQKVYNTPNMTVQEMNSLFVELAKEYGIVVDGRSWCEISHNYEMPFYYLSYSVSAVAALEIWEKSLFNQEQGMTIYLNLVEASRESRFMESLEKVGLNSPLSHEAIEGAMKAVESYIDKEIENNNTLDQVA